MKHWAKSDIESIISRRGVIEVSWDVIRALLDLPPGTQFIAAERKGDGETIGLIIAHPALEKVDPQALPVIKPVWLPPLEASFRGWVKVG